MPQMQPQRRSLTGGITMFTEHGDHGIVNVTYHWPAEVAMMTSRCCMHSVCQHDNPWQTKTAAAAASHTTVQDRVWQTKTRTSSSAPILARGKELATHMIMGLDSAHIYQPYLSCSSRTLQATANIHSRYHAAFIIATINLFQYCTTFTQHVSHGCFASGSPFRCR
jgi:hypothetical protein